MEWIKCRERLPDSNAIVVVCAKGMYSIANYYTQGTWFEPYSINMERTLITHWMPLPNPPTTDD